jgi:hypothetical protein
METESTGLVSAVSTYITTSLTMSHSLTVTDDSLTAGEIYTFQIRAKNAKDYSEWSDGLIVA